MNSKEITDKLATECMGWVSDGMYYREQHINIIADCSPIAILVINWHPLTDWNHMMICVEKMRKQGWFFALELAHFQCHVRVQRHNDYYNINNEDPLLAIAEAIGKAQGWWEEDSK